MISAAHQMCFHIIDQLKDLLDDKDMTLMRRFIREQFAKESKFTYASGVVTDGVDKAELTKITILIKAATQKRIDAQDKDADANLSKKEKAAKKAEIEEWKKWLEEKFNERQTLWEKKNEDDNDSDEYNSEEEDDEESKENAKILERLLNKFKQAKAEDSDEKKESSDDDVDYDDDDDSDD